MLDNYKVCELIGIDNNESELFFLEDKFADFDNVSFFLADVRDRDKISRKMKHMDIVFHTAAFKHVILCERSPFEAVQTNILGIQNIINGAIENNVERVIFTSSDKAVNPTNVMGASKLMGERLMAAANSNSRDNGPIFYFDPLRQCSWVPGLGNSDLSGANSPGWSGNINGPGHDPLYYES